MSSLLIPSITDPTGISFCTVKDTIGVIRFSDVLDWQGQVREEAALCFETQHYFKCHFVEKAIELGFKKLIIDLSELKSFDSSGLWVVYETHKKCVAIEGQAVFVIRNPNILRMLTITKTIQKLIYFGGFDEAVRRWEGC